jgi:hypothetical protein
MLPGLLRFSLVKIQMPSKSVVHRGYDLLAVGDFSVFRAPLRTGAAHIVCFWPINTCPPDRPLRQPLRFAKHPPQLSAFATPRAKTYATFESC